jgi:hypothetical protein
MAAIPANGLNGAAQSGNARSRLSYKFQRLREQLRNAIERGEFSGRLPGERDLGRRFHANAKTINKALSDLSAEGLVVRHVGRGTYVAGSDAESGAQKPRCFWWSTHAGESAAITPMYRSAHRHLCDMSPSDSLIAVSLTELARGGGDGRALRDADGIVVLGATPDEVLMSELIRRHIPTILVGGSADAPRVHQVVSDDGDAGFRVTEHLAQMGFKDIRVVGDDTTMSDRVYSGYHAACKRRRLKTPAPVSLEEAATVARRRDDVALIVVGAAAIESLCALAPESERKAAIAGVVEPGLRAAEQNDITAYEVAMDRIAEWVVRLLCDARTGQPPVQVVVPGRLVIRASSAQPHHTEESTATLVEAVI